MKDRVVELKIERLVAGGEGLARHNKQAVFIPLVLPGERVKARITEERKGFLKAEPVEILSSSAHRQVPACPVYGECGGCNLQHIHYEEQLRQKTSIVQETFQRIGKISFTDPVIKSSPPLGYRNRVQLHFDGESNLGFMARGSNRIVSIVHCPVSVARINQFLLQPSLPSPGRYLLFATDSWRALEGEDLGTVHSVKLLGSPVRFTLDCFFQSNLTLLPELLEDLKRAAKGKVLLDLYSGIGLFGAMLKDRYEKIIAVEENPAAAARARENIGREHLFLQTRVEKLRYGFFKGLKPDTIIVDPPRSGLSGKAKQFLNGSGAPYLFYISCNYVTLARDLKALLAANWSIKRIFLYDFYPQTDNLEIMAVLAR